MWFDYNLKCCFVYADIQQEARNDQKQVSGRKGKEGKEINKEQEFKKSVEPVGTFSNLYSARLDLLYVYLNTIVML